MKQIRKTTTFPLPWEKVIKLENQLLMRFLETEKLTDATDLMTITLGCRMGLRVNDLLQFRWKDLSDVPVGEDLIVKERKTQKLRILRMTSKIKTILGQVLRVVEPDPGHYIFSSTHGRGLKPMSVNNFNVRLRRILKSNKVRVKGNPSSHLLRKSFVLASVKNGFRQGDALSLVKVSRMINHSSLSQTLSYVNFETTETLHLSELD